MKSKVNKNAGQVALGRCWERRVVSRVAIEILFQKNSVFVILQNKVLISCDSDISKSPFHNSEWNVFLRNNEVL
jgi:hypothetical protein